VESADLNSLRVTGNAQFTILDDQGPITISGDGLVSVEGFAHGITFRGLPRLSLSPYSQVIDAAGPVRLHNAPHAHLAGRVGRGLSSRDGIEIEGIYGQVEGVSLVNFSVPLSWVATEVFDTIRKNAILATALLHPDLPGMRDTVKSWITKPRLRRRNVDPVELDYASAISGLSHIGNSPASVRTKLAWCAYRIRHLQTIGKAERFILGAYRLIGYGEWLMPAFILCFFFALSMAMVYLYLSGESLTLTVAGIKHFLIVVTGWLVSPLHLLNLTGEKEGAVHFAEPLDTLVRLLIAAPFATGVLALRKYVKDEKPD
jgi:hypothetical protein